MANVDYIRPEVSDMIERYQKIDDACEGQYAVKAAGEKYLPSPKADGVGTIETQNRYADYKARAQYVNFSGRSVEALTGLIFSKPIEYTLPPLCQVVAKNADGSGVDLEQVTKVAVEHVIKKGRCGLFIDYPTTNKPTTVEDIQKGDIRPVVLVYNPTSVINWDLGGRGGKVYFTLVVLKEWYSERNPGDFEVKRSEQYRVLELVDSAGVRYGEKIGDNAVYRQRVYRKASANSQANKDKNLNGFEHGGDVYPLDFLGKTLSEIPFTFIGSKSNNADVDKPPLTDIVDVNIGHYINSADYEDSVFLVGQPTPVVTGVSDEWWDTKLKKRLTLGSRATIPLEVGAEIKLIQAQPNGIAMEAMKDKKEQIVALGAKIVEETGVAKTATEDTNDNIAENSVLGNIANNVETAIRFGLEWCAIFTGEVKQDADAQDNSIVFKLNKKFNTQGSTPAERAQLLKEFLADAMTFEEYRSNLRLSGVALGKDDEALTKIKTEQQEQIDFEADRNKALAAAGAGNVPGGGVKNKATGANAA